jgi:hypothetical protein
MSVAHCSIIIPVEHGINSLRKLRAAGFIDANSVNTGDNMEAIEAFTRPVMFNLKVNFNFAILHHPSTTFVGVVFLQATTLMRLLTLKGPKMDPLPQGT